MQSVLSETVSRHSGQTVQQRVSFQGCHRAPALDTHRQTVLSIEGRCLSAKISAQNRTRTWWTPSMVKFYHLRTSTKSHLSLTRSIPFPQVCNRSFRGNMSVFDVLWKARLSPPLQFLPASIEFSVFHTHQDIDIDDTIYVPQ
jgi:hypothetical protein